MNKRECFVNGRLGLVMNSYTHTVDVYIYKTRRLMSGVNKRFVHLKPLVPTGNSAQLKLEL